MVDKINLNQTFGAKFPEKDNNSLKRDLALKLLVIKTALAHVEKLVVKSKETINLDITTHLTEETSNKSAFNMIREQKIAISETRNNLTNAVNKASTQTQGAGLGDSNSGFPTNWGGSFPYPDNSVLGRLWILLTELKNDPDNPKIIKELQKFLEQFAQSKFAKDPSKLAYIFNLLAGIQGNSENLLQFMIKFLAGELYFEMKKEGKSDAQILAALDKLLEGLKGLPGMGPEVAALEDFISNFSNWSSAQDGKTLAEFLIEMGNQLAKLFEQSNENGSSGISGVLGKLSSADFEALLKRFKDNPLAAVMMWFYMHNLESNEAELGGFGDLLKYIENAIGNLKKLEAEFNKGEFSPESAKQFIEDLKNLKALVDNNPALAGIKDQVDGAISAILNISINNSTLGTLFTEGKFSELAKALKSITSNLTGPEGQIFLDNLKQLNTSFTDQSSVVNTKIQEANSMMQTMLNSMNKSINEGLMSMLTAFVKNQRSS